MTTSTNSVAIPSVEIKDPFLRSFHNQRESAYADTKTQIAESCSTYENSVVDLEAFSKQIRFNGKQLQDELLNSIPSKEELEKQREGFLKQYQNFKTTCEKLKEFTINIQKTIQFITPTPRRFHEEKALKEQSPDLYQQTKWSEEICLRYVAELNLSYQHVNSLKDKMVTMVNDTTLSWSLQRFCQIVDNDGKPLPWYTRGVNYWTTPVVPKPTSQNLSVETKNHSMTLLNESYMETHEPSFDSIREIELKTLEKKDEGSTVNSGVAHHLSKRQRKNLNRKLNKEFTKV